MLDKVDMVKNKRIKKLDFKNYKYLRKEVISIGHGVSKDRALNLIDGRWRKGEKHMDFRP